MYPGYTKMFKEEPATHFCSSWWHKVRYGSSEKITKVNRTITIVEYFCKKCERKTCGFTHIGPFEVTIEL